jgi:hypothetical protein
VHFEREKRLEGRYVSSTTEEDVTALDAVAMYNQLMDVSARTLGHASAGRGRVPYADLIFPKRGGLYNKLGLVHHSTEGSRQRKTVEGRSARRVAERKSAPLQTVF